MNKEIRVESIELTKVELDKRELSKYLWMKSAFIRFNT